MGRQGTVCNNSQTGVQGAINRLLGTFRHVTPLIGSTDLETFVVSRDQKHTNLVRVSTQNWDQARPTGSSLRVAFTAEGAVTSDCGAVQGLANGQVVGQQKIRKWLQFQTGRQS